MYLRISGSFHTKTTLSSIRNTRSIVYSFNLRTKKRTLRTTIGFYPKKGTMSKQKQKMRMIMWRRRTTNNRKHPEEKLIYDCIFCAVQSLSSISLCKWPPNDIV